MPGINTSMGTSASMKSLLKTEREMLTAMERISSGKRINNAGDDAAGAAISDRMTATIRACLLYTSPSPRDRQKCRMPSSA